jgi:Ni,Fe-hydrogenase III small subunit
VNEEELGTDLKKRIKEVLRGSLHIRHVDAGSCNGCDFEMSTLSNPIYDISRFGVSFVPSPRQADMLMVTGGVTSNLEKALRITYEATPKPKMVIAIGACACGGGVFGETYANAGGIDPFVPVYVYVPGCPPRPQALIQGILLALDQYQEVLKRGE